MDSVAENNTRAHPEKVLRAACSTGDTSDLARLIANEDFKVNESLSDGSSANLPLLVAISEQSLPVAKLLLDQDADPNANKGSPLRRALEHRSANLDLVCLLLDKGAQIPQSSMIFLEPVIESGRADLVRLMLERGYDFKKNYEYIIMRTFGQYSKANDSGILQVLVDHSRHLAEDPNADFVRKLDKYLQFCKAVLEDNGTQVGQLLEDVTDYESYGGIVQEEMYPSCLAVNFRSFEAINAFFEKNFDLVRIFYQAVRKGDLEIIELCGTRPGFNPVQTQSPDYYTRDQNALHEACTFNQLEAAKLLVRKFGFRLEGGQPHKLSITPLYYIDDINVLRGLLAAFPETDLDRRGPGCVGGTLLYEVVHRCDFYTTILEHGPHVESQCCQGMQHKCDEVGGNDDEDDEMSDEEDKDDKKNERGCKVVRFLQKMVLIDPGYVRKIFWTVLPIHMQQFENLENPLEDEYKFEIAQMQKIRISQLATSEPAKSLYDFIFFGANEAANYSKNEDVLKIYKEHREDFQKFMPNYGFLLNYKLRRGTVRYERFKVAEELLCFAFGTSLMKNFTEFIFVYFSNGTLKHFDHYMTSN